MSDIHIVRSHHLSLSEAKKAVQEAAGDLAAEYDLESEWKGNTLHFSRSGVDGTMTVSAGEVELDVTLGFLLRAFSASFESHIERHLSQHLSEHAKLAKAAKKTSTPKA
ncbi:MAG: polyhydroxyalkanoic acid system family protein [Burkholderiaceae bacterium]